VSLAYANKEEMKVWKSAKKPVHDGASEHPITNVILQIEDHPQKGMCAYLTATDAYQIIKREITAEDSVEPVEVRIPRSVVEQAEKAMAKGDRAYFEPNQIKIVEVLTDRDTLEETIQVKAMLPFAEQLELDFPDTKSFLESAIDPNEPVKKITVNAAHLRRVLDQFKLGNNSVWLHIQTNGQDKPLKISAFEQTDSGIFSAVMPIVDD
jgi:DNA polymerase III sliding clamp (beta) subunit (PCNA family)